MPARLAASLTPASYAHATAYMPNGSDGALHY